MMVVNRLGKREVIHIARCAEAVGFQKDMYLSFEIGKVILIALQCSHTIALYNIWMCLCNRKSIALLIGNINKLYIKIVSRIGKICSNLDSLQQ